MVMNENMRITNLVIEALFYVPLSRVSYVLDNGVTKRESGMICDDGFFPNAAWE